MAQHRAKDELFHRGKGPSGRALVSEAGSARQVQESDGQTLQAQGWMQLGPNCSPQKACHHRNAWHRQAVAARYFGLQLQVVETQANQLWARTHNPIRPKTRVAMPSAQNIKPNAINDHSGLNNVTEYD
jgi:hypothetical protein